MIIDFNQELYSYDTLKKDALLLAKKYEAVLTYDAIGESHDHREILLLKLGIGKQYLICTAGVHGRESVNPIVMMGMIEFYANTYRNHKQRKEELKFKLNSQKMQLRKEYENMLLGACIYELLQTYTILFVPLLNPDGYMIAMEGFNSIQNKQLRDNCIFSHIPYQEWKYNARGVDINRNFPSKLWKAKQENDRPASENETKALMLLFQEYRSNGFLDFHSRGKQIYYYRSIMPDDYNKKQLEIADRIKKITNYSLMPPEDEVEAGDTGGNTVHYFSEHFSKPALTIETVDEEAIFPLDMNDRYRTYDELKMVIPEFGSMVV